MEKETKELLLKHIKSGHYAPYVLMDVQKLFEAYGMKLYAKLCCDRIQAAGLVDGVHVSRVYSSPWKFRMDAQGIEKCKSILEAYIEPERVSYAQESFQSYNDWITSANNIVYTLRKMKSKELKAGELSALEYKIDLEDVLDVKELLKAELLHRKFPYNLFQTINKCVFVAHLLIRFKGPMRVLVPFIKEAWRMWEHSNCIVRDEVKGKYGKALERFYENHGGTMGVKKLKGNNLVKYVYLAVRAYGKEAKTKGNNMKIKSCTETERRYKELNQVMKSIGRLSLGDLVQMYPVDKEYDGDTYGCKDYFFTKDKLKEWDLHKPIGDEYEAARLLWDYSNNDLMFFLLNWEDALYDMKYVCSQHECVKEYHNRWRSKGVKVE